MHEQPGLISLQRSQEGREASGAKPTEKCFYLARLSSLLKVRFFWESLRLRAEIGEPTLRFVKKRLWSLNGDIPRFLLYFLSPFFAIPRRRPRRPSGLTARRILTRVDRVDARRPRGSSGTGKKSGRNCVNYPLISASDPRITSRRECWSLSRLLSDVSEMAQRVADTGSARAREKSAAFHARETRFRRER